MTDLRIKLGQMLCVGFEGYTVPPELLEIIRTHKIGNIALFAHNFRDKAQTRQLTDTLKQHILRETGHPAMLAVDQEGGMVTRFSRDFTHFPGAMATAATGSGHYARQTAYLSGMELKNAGLNANLAPVVDINGNPDNPVIGVRSYGDTPEKVNRYAMEALAGMEQAGVLSMLKHFPGHGDTSQDSHFSLPRVEKTLEELLAWELIPFMEGIRRGAPAVMTSHIVYPNIDPSGLPATMSRVLLHDVLRRRLGFEGIIRTDDLEMEAIRQHFGIVPGALTAAKAGADILSISRSPALGAELIECMEAQIASGEMDISIVEQAYTRILRCKTKYFSGESSADLASIGCETSRQLAQEVSRQSITLHRDRRGQLPVRGRVLVIGTNAFNQTNVRNPLQLELNAAKLLSQRLCGEGITVGIRPTSEECAQAMEGIQRADTVVLCTYNAHLFQEQLELARRLAEAHPNVIFAAMRNPYDLPLLPEECAALAVYEYTPVSIDTLGDILAGDRTAQGRIPVQLDTQQGGEMRL